MGKNVLTGIFILVLLCLSFLPSKIFGADPDYIENLIKGTPIIKGEGKILESTFFSIIQYLLSFLGVVFLLIIVYGGILWMTAAGNEEKVGKAKKTLQRGLIGLVIVLLAFAIAMFVIGVLQDKIS